MEHGEKDNDAEEDDGDLDRRLMLRCVSERECCPSNDSPRATSSTELVRLFDLILNEMSADVNLSRVEVVRFEVC